MKIAIILPFKELYNKFHAGAVSILVNSHIMYSQYKKSTIIYGSEVPNPMNKNIFRPIKKTKIFTNSFFIKKISSHSDIDSSTIVEIHNRPEYFIYLKKKFPYKKFILFFHNDPTNLNGSQTTTERQFIYENCDQIIFLSEWIKEQFKKNTSIDDSNLHIFYPGIETIDRFPKKENIILFVGKLNSDKGYDIYQEAIDILLKKFSRWKSISIGSENRRIIPLSNNTSELGQISNRNVLKLYEKASIAVANSVRDEPLGRLPIEASSRGCISIVSKSGGLTETIDSNSIILKHNNARMLAKNLESLISNKKNLRERQLKIFNNFRYNLKDQTLFLDNVRSLFLKKKKKN